MTDLRTLGEAMRDAQRAYFKDRSRDNLIASKQAETAFDKALLSSSVVKDCLTTDCNVRRQIIDDRDRTFALMLARATAAEVQVAALREALALFTCDCAPKIECADPSYCRNSIARAALEEK